MKNTRASSSAPLTQLDARRRSLGMSHATLAHACGLSLPTVYRILSGRHPHASWSAVAAIARTLGLDITFQPIANTQDLRHQQARHKAQQLLRMVQATSALEGQAVDAAGLEEMLRQTVHELLAGSNRALWAR